MGLSISAYRPTFPPMTGVGSSEQTRAPRVDPLDVAGASPVNETLNADFVELVDSPHQAACDEYVAVAPCNMYQKFSEDYGFSRSEILKNQNRFDPNSTLHGINGTAGADPVEKCRRILIA